MEVETLIVRPSLLGVSQLFGRALVVGHINSKLRLTQVKVNAAHQQQNNDDRRDSDSLHTTPLESPILSLFST
jgi:hypothetical protein